MNTPIRDTDLVFADLVDAKRALDRARGSPREVRRAFSRFVELTQKLTAAMRRDYSCLKNARWEAKCFSGWNADTAFLKWLRNEDQHAAQIYISVRQRNFYKLEAMKGQMLVFEGTWVLNDQLTPKTPCGISLHVPDAALGSISNEVIPPVRVEHLYLFQPRTAKAEEWLRKLGSSDIHQLAERALQVFSSYYEYFRAQAGV